MGLEPCIFSKAGLNVCWDLLGGGGGVRVIGVRIVLSPLGFSKSEEHVLVSVVGSGGGDSEDILAAFSQIWAGSSFVGLNPGFVQFSTFNTVYRRVGVFIGWSYTNHHVCLSVSVSCLLLCPSFGPKICSELICGVLHLWSCFLVSVCLSLCPALS